MKRQTVKMGDWPMSGLKRRIRPPSGVGFLRFDLRSLVLCFLIFVFVTGCRQKMGDQPRYDPLEPSNFFEDGQSARPLVPGTVPRGYLREDTRFYMGKSGQSIARAFPFPVTSDVLNRGQERFNIYCSPCHDRVGTGDGMIVRRGYTRPPSFHIDRLRNAPVGHFFDVITNGFGAMPAYATLVPPYDRWAIIAYIRALQLSQHATLADIPEEERDKLNAGGQQQ